MPARQIRLTIVLLILCTLCALSADVIATPDPTSTPASAVSGRVLDNTTREPVVSANILLVGTTLGTTTDLNGSFTLSNLEPGSYSLQVSALGYRTQLVDEINLLPNRVRTVEVLLEETVLENEAVTFTTGYFANTSPDLPTSSRSLRYEEVRRAPGAAEDVQRAIQALPGVAGESDQNNEIVVRGGDPSENLTVMDGIEVENINHFGYVGSTGGPVSALNNEFLQDVTFASGGFSARYGDKLSSVLDLTLREGSRSRFSGAANLGMAGIGGNVEGPIQNGRGSYLIAARKSYLDWVAGGGTGLTSVPYYWNTQAKIAYDLSSRHLLTVNALYANDKILIDEDEEGSFSRGVEKVDTNSDRLIAGARLRSLWGAGYTDLVIAGVASDYYYDVYEIDYNAAGDRLESRWAKQTIDENTYQVSLHWNGNGFGYDDWGAGVVWKPVEFTQDTWRQPDTTVFNDGYLQTLGFPVPADGLPDTVAYADYVNRLGLKSSKFGGYLQYRWRPVNRFSLLAGARYDGFAFSDDHTVAPRLSLSWLLHRDIELTAAYGIYYQAQPLFQYVWDPFGGNETLPHIRADQYVLGISLEPRSSTRLSVEGYYKEYSDLLVPEEAVVRETTGNYFFDSERMLADRAKTAWGVEVFAQQRMSANWYGTFSYSYGKAETDDPAWGVHPASYDFRHVSTLVLGYRTSLLQYDWYRKQLDQPWGIVLRVLPLNGDELQLSTRYRFISGRPYTPQVWYEEGEASPDPIYEAHWAPDDRNSANYPSYSRWDVRLDNKYYFGKTSLTFYLEVQNVLDRKNVSDYAYGDDGEVDTIYQFRFFFVGGIRFEF